MWGVVIRNNYLYIIYALLYIVINVHELPVRFLHDNCGVGGIYGGG